MRAKFKSSPRHEEVKRADRIRKKSRVRTLMKYQDFAPRFLHLRNFKELMMYLALFRHLMVPFTYTRLVERN